MAFTRRNATLASSPQHMSDFMDTPYISGSSLDGTDLVPMVGARNPSLVWVAPGAGCTVRVSLSHDPQATADPAGSHWVAWPPGDVTAYAEYEVENCTALKIERTVGTANTTRYGVI